MLPLLLAAAIVMNLNDWRLAFWCIFTATTGVRVAGGGGDASTQIIHVDEFLKSITSTTSTNRLSSATDRLEVKLFAYFSCYI